MNFYSFPLLLFVGETSGLYIRETYQQQGLESRTPDQASQCSTKTDTVIWHTDPEYAKMDDLVDVPVKATTSCRDRSLLKRQMQPSKNVFNLICKRELDGKRISRKRTVDVMLGTDDTLLTVPTPGGGTIDLWADQSPVQVAADHPAREELSILVVNRSPCPVQVEWLTRLQLFPDRNIRSMPSDELAPRSLAATPRRSWVTEPHSCFLTGIRPTAHLLIAVRLLITALNQC